MDKSLDEIIGSTTTPREPSSGVSKRGGRRRRGGRSRAPRTNPKALYITNLSDAITEDDLRDLFRQVGPVVRVEIERNSAGDRSGRAWVLYDFSEDALVAQERFNQRKAAGRTITVRRVERIGDTGSSVSLEERIGERTGRRSRGGRRKQKAESKPPRARSAAELDAELDAYMQVESSVPSNQEVQALSNEASSVQQASSEQSAPAGSAEVPPLQPEIDV